MLSNCAARSYGNSCRQRCGFSGPCSFRSTSTGAPVVKGADKAKLLQPLHVAWASNGKGFGTPQQQPSSGTTPEMKQALKASGSKGSSLKKKGGAPANAPSARPVEAGEAAKGKIDFVQVKDWGSGEPARLGDLRVERLERRYSGAGAGATSTDVSAVSSSGQAAGAGTGGSSKGASPQPALTLYDELAREVAMAEKRGCLAVAGGPTPPLEAWSFREARYTQYLTDCAAVHGALDAALQAVASHSLPAADAAAAADRDTAALVGCASALKCLHEAGLGRSQALAQDLLALRATAAAGPGGTAASSTAAATVVTEAGAMPRAHASQLARFARDVSTGLSAVTVGAAAGTAARQEAVQQGLQAAAQLFAHAYTLQLVHQASGMRFGAAAVEKLGLMGRRAISFYHAYPPAVKDPLQALQCAVNAAGAHLGPAQREAVAQELPRAMRNASLLMEALAHTD